MRSLTLVAVLFLATAGSTLAQPRGQPTPAEAQQWVEAPPNLPKGVLIAVLSGDPEKSGPFEMLLKLPPNSRIGAHTHPTAEALKVVSGSFYVGMGEKFDAAKAERLGPGGSVEMAANMAHFAFTSDEEAVVQVRAEGPFVVQYLDPADDPSKNLPGSSRT